MNNERNKLLAALVGDCYHDIKYESVGADLLPVCQTCGKRNVFSDSNTDYFADPPHSKIDELMRCATIKFGWEAVENAVAVEIEKERVQPYAGSLTGFNFACATANQKASAIVNLIKEAENGEKA